jgi:hypothetical protein
MLTSSPNSRGISPASANRKSFLANGRLVYHTRQNERTGRTGQFVLMNVKFIQVDELPEFRGN